MSQLICTSSNKHKYHGNIACIMVQYNTESDHLILFNLSFFLNIFPFYKIIYKIKY